jgi:diaminopimelate epimerase
MGNPHAVLIVPNVDKADVAKLGPLIENHPQFPQRTNVGFMQIHHSSVIRLRVYERGAGETLACGSGACAAVVAGRQLGLLEEAVVVHLPGGDLVVKWHSEGQPVLIEGPAETVYEGTIEL